MRLKSELLPKPPEVLAYGDVRLQFVRISPGDASRGFAPFYNYRIETKEGKEAGHINFRVGDSNHIMVYAGHIGYEVLEPFRGNGFAYQACKAIAPLVRMLYPEVIITCDPDNLGSMRTIEKLGAAFLDEVSVGPEQAGYARKPGRKRRYSWKP
jgi:predicted acetyltransferase